MNENKALWMHFEVKIQQEYVTEFILKTLNTYQGDCYFDRVNTKDEVKLYFHIKSTNKITDDDIKLTQFPCMVEKVESYKLDDEISELCNGEMFEPLYLEFSLESMYIVKSYLEQIKGNNKSISDIAFDLMSNYILDKTNRSVFFSGTSERDIPYDFLSFRSHSDGYFIRMGDEESFRKKFEMLYQAQKAKFIARFNLLNNRTGDDDLLQKWTELIEQFSQSSEIAFEKGSLEFAEDEYNGGFIGNNYVLSDDNFHKKTANNELFYHYIRENLNMKIFRLMTGFMYITLHRLGLPYAQRNIFCYIIARVVEDIYQVDVDAAVQHVMKSISGYHSQVNVEVLTETA